MPAAFRPPTANKSAGMTESGHQPQRTCLGCRQTRNQRDLARFVLSPAREILADYRFRLPGRGAYVCFSRECLGTAVKRGQLQRAFRQPDLHVDAELLLTALRAAIERKIVNLLGMAKKSGVVVSGSGLVLDALKAPGRLAVVFLAEDVSAGIGDRVMGSALAKGVLCWRLLDKERLGGLLGKEERSVVGLESGALAESIKAEMLRYKQIAGDI